MNRTDMDDTSLRTLAEQASEHLRWMIFSFIGILTNLAVLITIAKTKSLHNKSQMVIFSHSLAEVFCMCGYFGTALARYAAFALSQPQTMEKMSCALRQMPQHVSSGLVRISSVALALDRFLCVAFPIFYRTLGPMNYTLTLNSIIWLYALLERCIGFMFVDDSTSMIPICHYAIIFAQRYTLSISGITNVWLYAVIALYTISATILLLRYKKARFTELAQRSEWRRRMEFDVFIAMLVISMIYLSCSGTAILLASIANASSLGTALVLSPFASMCTFVSSFSHLFVYLKLNPRFKEGFKKIFRLKKQSAVVHPVVGE